MMKKTLGRVVASVAVLGLALTASACSTPTEETTSSTSTSTTVTNPSELPSAPTPTATPIPVSTTLDGVEATGAFGESPTLTIPTPWAIGSTTTEILVQGDGITVPDTGVVQVNYYGMNARSGEVFDESYSTGAPITFSIGGGTIAGFQKGLAGQKVGTRLVVAIPGADGYDSDGGNETAGIQVGDTLVFVIDVVNTEILEPTGETVAVTDPSLPTVSGELMSPQVEIPHVDPPSELVVQPLIKGEGPAVTADSTIKVNYAEYIWNSGKLVRQTFGYNQPLSGPLTSTIEGWQKGLVEQTAGSRIMLVVPPSMAYPQGYPKISVPEGSTMVYIIDIQYAATS